MGGEFAVMSDLIALLTHPCNRTIPLRPLSRGELITPD
jgi:hypothetical protein